MTALTHIFLSVIFSCFHIVSLFGQADGESIWIRNGMIYDGTGSHPFSGDIIIQGDLIAHVGAQLTCDGCVEMDAEGYAISPGFIDIHAHLEPLLLLPDAESALQMGVTTAFGGPDGSSPINLALYLSELERERTGINVGYLIGHGSVRAEVMGMESRAPSKEELNEMGKFMLQAMEDGAFGVSTGLKYLPGTFASFDELVFLSKLISAKGGIYTSHLREEGLGLIDAVEEAINIGKDADIPIVLTHHKAIGQPAWGQSRKTLAMVDAARAKGIDVMIDQYPYTASHTGISVLIPPWAMEGGKVKRFAERCENPILRDSVKSGIIFNILNDRGGGDLRRIQFAKFDWKPSLEGKTLYDWCLQEGMSPTPENGAELVISAQIHGGANGIFHAMDQDDVERIMTHEHTIIASDGRITEFGKGHPHPRVYGTFPRVLGRYSRDKGLFPLEVAIMKMTSMPAQRMALTDRGIIGKGMKADLVIFDAQSIMDQATFEDPHQYPTGIHCVFVNGKIALQNGSLGEKRAGVVLRGPGFQKKD